MLLPSILIFQPAKVTKKEKKAVFLRL